MNLNSMTVADVEVAYRLKVAGVYRIRNLTNGKVYVGQSWNMLKRWNDHVRDLRDQKHRSIKMQRAWNKYGAASFVFEVIEEQPEVPLRTACEQKWIDHYQSATHRGYNVSPTAGTSFGVRRSKATKLKQSLAAKRRLADPEFRKRMNDNQKGWRHSDEAKAKMSLARKGKKHSATWVARLKASLNDPECKARRMLATKGVPKSPETRARMKIAQQLLAKQKREQCN